MKTKRTGQTLFIPADCLDEVLPILERYNEARKAKALARVEDQLRKAEARKNKLLGLITGDAEQLAIKNTIDNKSLVIDNDSVQSKKGTKTPKYKQVEWPELVGEGGAAGKAESALISQPVVNSGADGARAAYSYDPAIKLTTAVANLYGIYGGNRNKSSTLIGEAKTALGITAHTNTLNDSDKARIFSYLADKKKKTK